MIVRNMMNSSMLRIDITVTISGEINTTKELVCVHFISILGIVTIRYFLAPNILQETREKTRVKNMYARRVHQRTDKCMTRGQTNTVVLKYTEAECNLDMDK